MIQVTQAALSFSLQFFISSNPRHPPPWENAGDEGHLPLAAPRRQNRSVAACATRYLQNIGKWKMNHILDKKYIGLSNWKTYTKMKNDLDYHLPDLHLN